MIDSVILENYAPIIVPLTFIYGLRDIIHGLPLGELKFIGNIVMIISLLIYYDRVADDNREVFAIGLALLFVSYVSLRMVSSIGSLCLITSALVLIGRGIVNDFNFSNYSQRIYISLILLYVGFISMLVENNSLPPRPISLLINSLGITILTLSTIELSKA